MAVGGLAHQKLQQAARPNTALRAGSSHLGLVARAVNATGSHRGPTGSVSALPHLGRVAAVMMDPLDFRFVITICARVHAPDDIGPHLGPIHQQPLHLAAGVTGEWQVWRHWRQSPPVAPRVPTPLLIGFRIASKWTRQI